MEEVLQKIQQISSYNHGTSNKFFQQRNFPQQTDKSQSQGMSAASQNVAGKLPTTETVNVNQQQHVQQPQQQVIQTQMQNLPNGQPNQANRATPLPQGISRCVRSSEVYNWVM